MSDDSIKVKLVGGLGNQLFIWATAYSISKRRNLDLVIDASECTQRGFELAVFGIEAAIKPLNPPDGILPTRFPNSQSRWIKQFHKWRNGWRYFRLGKNFWERSGGFDHTVFSIPKGKNLRGYFQSYKYFQEIQEEIRGILGILTFQSEDFITLSKSLSLSPWVAIHIRRQDYELSQNTIGLINRSYYENAIHLLGLTLPNIKKYVFSDDIAQAKQILPGCDGYIGSDNLISAAETLVLMSQANAIIGANSSFSWWAAFLMKAEDNLKFFPEPWVIDRKLNNNYLVPPSWTRISVLEN